MDRVIMVRGVQANGVARGKKRRAEVTATIESDATSARQKDERRWWRQANRPARRSIRGGIQVVCGTRKRESKRTKNRKQKSRSVQRRRKTSEAAGDREDEKRAAADRRASDQATRCWSGRRYWRARSNLSWRMRWYADRSRKWPNDLSKNGLPRPKAVDDPL
jgi:hypothetical protein